MSWAFSPVALGGAHFSVICLPIRIPIGIPAVPAIPVGTGIPVPAVV